MQIKGGAGIRGHDTDELMLGGQSACCRWHRILLPAFENKVDRPSGSDFIYVLCMTCEWHLDHFCIAHGENERRWLRRPGRGACVGRRSWPAGTGERWGRGLRSARRTRAQVVRARVARGGSATDGREEDGVTDAVMSRPDLSFFCSCVVLRHHQIDL